MLTVAHLLLCHLLYSAVDQLASYTPPSLGAGPWATTDQVDADHNLVLETRPDTAAIAPDYDAAGRVAHLTYPQGQITRTYSPTTGQLKSVAAPSGETLSYGYDGSLLTAVTWTGPVAGAVTSGYDSSWRVVSQMINGQSLSFGYDKDSLLKSAGALTVSRDPQNGRLTATTLGSITDSTGYDANGLLASYAAQFGTTTLYAETIVSRDGDQRITERTESVQGTTTDWVYTYDPAGRLATVTKNGTLVSQYGYDADDNRSSAALSGSAAVIPFYDAQDRLTTYGGATFAYGANGELQTKTTASQTLSTTYDVFGNLLHAGFSQALGDGTTAVDYVVDAANRQVGRKVNGALASGLLYQDGLRAVAQVDSTGTNVVARFVYGTKANVPDYLVTTSPSATYRILSDHLGSPRLVVNTATGAVAERIDYDEFGNVAPGTGPGTGSVTIPFGFAGGIYDRDTGLVRFGARDYDPSVGRWTSKDPTRFGGGDANLYNYAGQDPVNFADPSGTFAWLPIAVGFAGGAAFDIAVQLAQNGGRWDCLDATQAAAAGALGAISGLLGAVEGVAVAEPSVGAAESAYSVAANGGRNAGFLGQAEQWTTPQLQRAERSLQEMIEFHEAKIADPVAHAADWGTRSEQAQEGLLRHWGKEITNFAEQQSIVQEILFRRGQ